MNAVGFLRLILLVYIFGKWFLNLKGNKKLFKYIDFYLLILSYLAVVPFQFLE